MWRRWIVGLMAAAPLCFSPQPLQAQSGASLTERLFGERAPAAPSTRQPAAPYARQPAAASSRQPVAPRAAAHDSYVRPAGYQDEPNSSSGGLLGRLKLNRLLPGGGAPERSNSTTRSQRDEPPMPYDQAELEAARRTATPPRTSAANAPRTTSVAAGAPRSSGPARSAPARAYQGPLEIAAPVATPAPAAMTARRSPAPAVRRSELAEALQGLQAPPEATAAATLDLPPAITSDEETPAYLREAPSARGTTAGRRTSSSATSRGAGFDLSQALRAPSPADQLAADAARANATTSQPALTPQTRQAPVQELAPALAPAELPLASDMASASDASASDDEAGLELQAPGAVAASSTRSAAVAPRANSSVPGFLSTADDSPTPSRRSAALQRAAEEVLVTCEQPALRCRIEGAGTVTVGREAVYRVMLQNQAGATAREVVAALRLPAWIEVMNTEATRGRAETIASEGEADSHDLVWRLDDLAVGAVEELKLTAIAREGRDLPLSVRLSHAPESEATVVQVREPKLHIELTGPADVLYGEAQRYSLSLSNPGTGAAEEVVVELLPPGGDAASMVTHPVGTVEPGQRKTLELELTAREAGALQVQAAAVAAGGVRAETVKEVLCRRPGLEIDWRGPEEKYAGAIATYYLRLRNPGNAITPAVQVKVDLPQGAEFIEASAGHAVAAGQQQITWKSAGLPPGEEQFMQFQCRFTRPGANSLQVSAEAVGAELTDAKTIVAQVVAMADLELEVTDPKGPVAVGDLAKYEVRVRNRGASAAKGVDVVVLFSEGIEPVQIEGGEHTYADGRVTYRTLEELGAGRDAVFTIQAKAAAEGVRVFRAEVACPSLDIKLSAEETTKFFVDQYRWDSASGAYDQQ